MPRRKRNKIDEHNERYRGRRERRVVKKYRRDVEEHIRRYVSGLTIRDIHDIAELYGYKIRSIPRRIKIKYTFMLKRKTHAYNNLILKDYRTWVRTRGISRFRQIIREVMGVRLEWNDLLKDAFYYDYNDFRKLYIDIRGDRRKYRSIMRSIDRSRSEVLVYTRYFNNQLDMVLSKNIEKYLHDPARQDATMEALSWIFKQVLSTSYKIDMPPGDVRRLIDIIRWITRMYMSYGRDMPCKRTQYMLKLTPLTIHITKGYAFRFYVVRFMRARDISGERLAISEPVDVYLIKLRNYKPRHELFSTMSYAGNGRVDEDTVISLWRDAGFNPRDIIKLFIAVARPSLIRQAMARASGARENYVEMGHCSIYIDKYRPPSITRNWKYIRARLWMKMAGVGQ